jgi:HAD superfamily hydrolase (TIGR01490 family)
VQSIGGILGFMVKSKPSVKGPLAVFDVDGTLFRRGLLPALTRRLVSEGIFPEWVREELSRDYYAWVERRGSYDTYDGLVVDLFLRELKGTAATELQRCARVEVEAHGRRLHMYTRDMAARLKRAGYQLIAISGSPQDILDLFLTPLGFDRSWGTVLAQDARGCYNGEVLHYPFKNKRQVLEEFLSDADVDLEGSVGIGDTLSDVGFLELVWTPLAFNPNRSLFEVAQRRGWPIVVERKDVIYNLQTPLEDPVLKDGTVWVG